MGDLIRSSLESGGSKWEYSIVARESRNGSGWASDVSSKFRLNFVVV